MINLALVCVSVILLPTSELAGANYLQFYPYLFSFTIAPHFWKKNQSFSSDQPIYKLFLSLCWYHFNCY